MRSLGKVPGEFLMSNPYSAASIPEKQRYFTTKEVAQMAGISNYHVYYLSHKLQIEWEVRPTGNSRASYFSWVDTQRIIEVANKRKSLHKARKEINLPPEEVREEHPLVTDLRCLELNFWPETQPKCFEDLDND